MKLICENSNSTEFSDDGIKINRMLFNLEDTEERMHVKDFKLIMNIVLFKKTNILIWWNILILALNE